MSTVALTRDQRSELRIRNNRIRRERELRRNIILSFVFVIVIMISVFTLLSVKSVASDIDSPTLYKYFTDVEVQPGDTLISIATEYNTNNKKLSKYIDEIAYLNNIKDVNSIKAGTVLVIPYYDVYK